MKSTSKSQSYLRDLKDRLTTRFAGSATIDTVRAANDSNGWPMLFCSHSGTESASNSVIAVRMSSADAVSKDIFGNQLTSFNPHLLEISYELTATDNPIPTDKDLDTVKWETFNLGVRTQIKEQANGTAVTAANMDSAAVLGDFDNLYHPNKGV